MSDDIRRSIEAVLIAAGYPEAVSAGWDITDFDDATGLACIHFRYEANPVELGRLRGLVVDTKNNKLIADSHGYIPTIALTNIPDDGKTVVDTVDLDGCLVRFDPSKYTYKLGFEGTMIRAMRYGGKTYFMTHRKLSSERGRWGKSRPFKTLYDELQGPKEEQLFDLTQPDSPFVYYFIVVHPEVSVVSQQKLNGGYIVYIGRRSVTSTQVPELTIEGVKSTTEISIAECNQHLDFGYYAAEADQIRKLPKQQWPGEFVIAYPKDPKDKLYRIESPSYRWRASLRGENPILLHQLFLLKDHSVLRRDTYREGFAEYLKYFPVVGNSISDIKDHVVASEEAHKWLTISKKDLEDDPDARFENIWKCLVVAVPLHARQALLEFLPTYRGAVTKIAMWLFGLEESGNVKNYEVDELASARIVNLCQTAASWASKGLVIGQTRAQVVQNNLIRLVKRENGKTLYKLWKTMQNEKDE